MHCSCSTLILLSGFILAQCYRYYAASTTQLVQKAGCLSSESQWVVVRGYLATGKVDENLASNAAAVSGATTHWAVTMWPCYDCGKSAADQATELKEALEDYGNKMVYVYVDGSTNWDKDTAKNREFLINLVKALGTASVSIATNSTYYEKVTGKDWTYMWLQPLAYINTNKETSCKDFAAFSGWTKAALKLYGREQTLCGNTVDLMSSC